MIIELITLAVLAWATYMDLQQSGIYSWMPFLIIVPALFLNPLFHSLLAAMIAGGIAWALSKAGSWASGDVLLSVAVGASLANVLSTLAYITIAAYITTFYVDMYQTLHGKPVKDKAPFAPAIFLIYIVVLLIFNVVL